MPSHHRMPNHRKAEPLMSAELPRCRTMSDAERGWMLNDASMLNTRPMPNDAIMPNASLMPNATSMPNAARMPSDTSNADRPLMPNDPSCRTTYHAERSLMPSDLPMPNDPTCRATSYAERSIVPVDLPCRMIANAEPYFLDPNYS